MRGEDAILATLALMVFAGVAVLWMSMHYRRRFREMAHLERLAMIERGLIPTPEADPERFERQTGLRQPESESAVRSRSVGVIMIGLGFAFMVLVTFAAGSPETGIGIGGAFAVLGGAFVFNSTLASRQSTSGPRRLVGEKRPPSAEPPPERPIS